MRAQPRRLLPPGTQRARRRRWRAGTTSSTPTWPPTAQERDRPDLDTTSRLSAHLAWGEVHPRTLLADLIAHPDASGPGAQQFLGELAWREFFADVLWHRPASAWSDLRPELADMQRDAAGAEVEAWRAGRTGFPLVDAGMRQLAARGWMHNRVRMVTASFLVKDLHVSWQVGAQHFLDRLVDGDLASNTGNWQWVAGTGVDAAPYFRIFNPVSQGLKFDPHGDYVRRWVPELAHLPGAAAHEPWRHPDGYAHGYPPPDRGPRRGAPRGAGPLRASQGPVMVQHGATRPQPRGLLAATWRPAPTGASRRANTERDPLAPTGQPGPTSLRSRWALLLLTFVLGSAALGITLNLEPGHAAFVPGTLAMATIWALGARACGPLTGSAPKAGPARRCWAPRPVRWRWDCACSSARPWPGWRPWPSPSRRCWPTAVPPPCPSSWPSPRSTASPRRRTSAAPCTRPCRARSAWLVSAAIYALATLPAGIALLTAGAAFLGGITGLLRRVSGGLLAPTTAHLIWSVGMLLLLPTVMDT